MKCSICQTEYEQSENTVSIELREHRAPSSNANLAKGIAAVSQFEYCSECSTSALRALSAFHREQRWTAYRDKLLHDPELPPAQRESVAMVLSVLARAEPAMMHPTVTRVDGEVALSWNPPGRSLDIAIKPTGALEWFFCNHATGYGDEGTGDAYAHYAVLFRYEAP